MSTLPLNWAPSAIVTRAAFTLPMTRAAGLEVDALVGRDVARERARDDQRPADDVGLDGRAVLDRDALFGRQLAAHGTATTTSSSVVISPSIVIPAPMTVLAMDLSVVPQRRADARDPRASPREAPPSSGGRFELAIESAREARAVVDGDGAARRLPRTRAPARDARSRSRHVALEPPRDDAPLRLDGFARRRCALGDREVAADGEVALDLTLDDEIPSP